MADHYNKKKKSISRVFRRKAAACVTVSAADGITGSGFFIRSSGVILTNAHVVLRDAGLLPNSVPREGLLATPINLNGIINLNRPVSCRFISADRAPDLAIIEVKTVEEDPINGFDIIKQERWHWGCSNCVRIGTKIGVIGNPRGANHVGLATGIISDNKWTLTPGITTIETILTSALAFSGNSGSPIFDEYEGVLGIHTFSINDIDGNPLFGFGGGTSQYIAEPSTNFMIKHRKDYDQKGYLGVRVEASLLAFVWRQIVTAAPNFTKVSDGNGFLIYKVDREHVSVGKGILYAQPRPLQQFDVLTALRVKGCKRWVKLGNDGERLFPTSHVTWLNPEGTEVEVEYIRLGENKVSYSTLILDKFPNELDVRSTSAQSYKIQKKIELKLEGKLQKMKEKI